MGRTVYIEDQIAPPSRGKKTSWSGQLAQDMNAGESVMFVDQYSAEKLRESIRHYWGKDAAAILKHPYCGWRVWRKK